MKISQETFDAIINEQFRVRRFTITKGAEEAIMEFDRYATLDFDALFHFIEKEFSPSHLRSVLGADSESDMDLSNALHNKFKVWINDEENCKRLASRLVQIECRLNTDDLEVARDMYDNVDDYDDWEAVHSLDALLLDLYDELTGEGEGRVYSDMPSYQILEQGYDFEPDLFYVRYKDEVSVEFDRMYNDLKSRGEMKHDSFNAFAKYTVAKIKEDKNAAYTAMYKMTRKDNWEIAYDDFLDFVAAM